MRTDSGDGDVVDEEVMLRDEMRRGIVRVLAWHMGTGAVVVALIASLFVDWSGGVKDVVGGVFGVVMAAAWGASVGLLINHAFVPWRARRWAAQRHPEMQEEPGNVRGLVVEFFKECGPVLLSALGPIWGIALLGVVSFGGDAEDLGVVTLVLAVVVLALCTGYVRGYRQSVDLPDDEEEEAWRALLKRR